MLRTSILCVSFRPMNPVEMLKERMGDRSLRALAREIPCSAPYLSDVLNGNRAAGPLILAFLGLEKQRPEVAYKKVRPSKKRAVR